MEIDALREAVAAYRDALKEYTRKRVSLLWAGTQNNLGNALFRLGERESGTKRLEEAVAACRDALKEYTRERVPLLWATTQTNLGSALTRRRPSTTYPSCATIASGRESGSNVLIRLGERESCTKRLEMGKDLRLPPLEIIFQFLTV